MRIAIIEDDEITRLELSKLLNTQGYETVLLIDFGNLTDELKQYSIELVLLDINLPYENGYEVCRKIKQVMPVPIIFTKVFSSCNASHSLYQNGRVPYGRKSSSIYYGTRPYRCNNGSV